MNFLYHFLSLHWRKKKDHLKSDLLVQFNNLDFTFLIDNAIIPYFDVRCNNGSFIFVCHHSFEIFVFHSDRRLNYIVIKERIPGSHENK